MSCRREWLIAVAVILGTHLSAPAHAGPNRSPAVIGPASPTPVAEFDVPAEKCRAILPPAKRARANYQDIYEKFVGMICEGDAARDSEWQACILQTAKSGRLRADDISVTYNECHPKFRACMDSARAVAPIGRGSKVEAAMKSFCLQRPNASSSTKECAVKALKAGGFFAEQPDLTFSLCTTPGGMTCFTESLAATGVRKTNTSALREIAATCSSKPITLEELSCALGIIKKGKLRASISTAFTLCAPEYREVGSCMEKYIEERVFHTKDHVPYEGEELRLARDVCNLSETSRECVIKMYRDGIHFRAGQLICSHASAKMQGCLRSAYHGTAPFNVPELKELRDHMETSYYPASWKNARLSPAPLKICQISSEKDRQCVIQASAGVVRNRGILVEHIDYVIEDCMNRSEQVSACIKDFYATIPVREVNEELRKSTGRTRLDPTKICRIGNEDVRQCVIRALPRMVWKERPLDEVIAACHVEFQQGSLQLESPTPAACE